MGNLASSGTPRASNSLLTDPSRSRHPHLPARRCASARRASSSASSTVRPGSPGKRDCQYARNGVADVLVAFEPLANTRRAIPAMRRGREEFARVVRHICDETRPGAERVVLVTDDPDTHGAASPCAAFPPEEARRLADRPGIHLAPRHGSWPGMAETGIGVPMGHGLPARVPDYDTFRRLREAWEDDRNARGGGVDWQFTNADARAKLKHLYPKIRLFGVSGG